VKIEASKIIGWVAGLSLVISVVTSCNRAPEVGSPEWCEAEGQPGKMDDYGIKEVMTFAKHCMASGESAPE